MLLVKLERKRRVETTLDGFLGGIGMLAVVRYATKFAPLSIGTGLSC